MDSLTAVDRLAQLNEAVKAARAAEEISLSCGSPEEAYHAAANAIAKWEEAAEIAEEVAVLAIKASENL